MKMDVQKGYVAKDTSGPLSSANPSISVAATKPILSNMESRSVWSTKTTSFASYNLYPPMSLKAPAPFGGEIKSKAVTSSLSGEGYSFKVGYFSFGSPVIASAVNKPIFEIKATEDKNNIYTPALSGSVKTSYPLVLWLQAPHQNQQWWFHCIFQCRTMSIRQSATRVIPWIW